MTTLEIIFVGLITFSPANDGQVLAMLSEGMDPDDHEPVIAQTVGSCTGHCRDDDTPDECVQGSLCWNPAGFELTWVDPCSSCGREELQKSLENLDGVLSIEEIVPGWGRLRPSCRSAMGSCTASSRVRIPSGRLEACHYIHPENDDRRRAVYEIGEWRGPIANVVSLTVPLESGHLALLKETYDGHMDAVAVLTPNDGDKIVLVVANEASEGSHSNGLPQELGHFRAFYRFLRPFPDMLGRAHRAVPQKVDDEWEEGGPGDCERYFKEAETVWVPYAAAAAPHGSSECDVATIP